MTATLLALALPASAQRPQPGSPEAVHQSRSSAEVSEFRAVRDRVIRVEAAVETQAAAYSRLEILIGLCSAIFGILITILILIFGFRTERSAARAATDAAKKEIEEAKKAIDSSVQAARNSCEQAEASLNKIRELEDQAEKGSSLIIERLKYTEKITDVSLVDASQDGEVANEVNEDHVVRLQREMTAALEAKDWDNLQEKAVALRALTSDPVVIINSLEYEAISYDRRSDRTREIETYRKILDVSESLADPEAREEVTVRAITNKAIASRQLGDEREEFNLWYQLASRFSSSQRPKTVRGVVLALAHIANIHDKRGESDEEIGVHDRIISSYSASGDPEVTRLVARSILNKGACLYNKKLYEQALPLFDQVLSEFGGVKAPAREATIAGAIFNRAKVFEQRGDIRDALSGFRSVVRRYSRSDDAAVQNLVVKARQNVKRLQALNAAEEKPSESGDKEE